MQRKRAIEIFFSQDQQASQKKAKSSDSDSDEETTSDIEFEVGGTITSSRYKLLYSLNLPTTFQEEMRMLLHFFPLPTSQVEAEKQGEKMYLWNKLILFWPDHLFGKTNKLCVLI